LRLLRGIRERRRKGITSAATTLQTGDVGDAPAWLPDVARSQWERLRHDLAAILAPADAIALEALCFVWSQFRRAAEYVTNHGSVERFTDSQGRERTRVSPHATAAATWLEHFSKLAGRFGMTPSDRARLNIAAHETEDELTHALRVIAERAETGNAQSN
jgi:P27 family predicted phage terminase small subunit